MKEEPELSAGADSKKSGSIFDMIRFIGIVAILTSIFLFVLAVIISQAETIKDFGISLGIPQYQNSESSLSTQDAQLSTSFGRSIEK